MAKTLEELKQQVSLADYVESEGYQLGKEGGSGSKRYRPVLGACPKCNHKNHLFIYTNTNSFYSHSNCCENGGSIIDWFIQVENANMNDAIDKLYFLAGEERPTRGDGQMQETKKTPSQPQLDAQPQPNSELDYTNYITKLHDNAIANYPQEMKEHFLNRGIAVGEIMNYQLSIYKDKDGLRAVLPVWKDGKVIYYTTRALEGQEARYKNAKGTVHMFNSHYLDNPHDEPIFITEGIMDALSLERFGYKAIAMNSADNAEKLKEEIRASGRLSDTVFISATDTDAAGRKAADILGFPTLEIPKPFKDVNEWLVDSFKKAQEDGTGILDIEDDINVQLEQMKQPDAIESYLENGFFKDITDLMPFRNKTTGFDNLDLEMKGLYAGLYVVGGISSVGKTTFVHQLGDQLAEQGDHVIYFSLEQSKLEMVSKSIARTTAKTNLNSAVSSIFIRNGDQSNAVKDAIQEYKKIAGRVNVIEGNFNTNVDTIRKYVARYKQLNNVNPVVIVDYLQIMPAANDRMNDKQKIDYNVTELKRLSRDFRIPVFVISSLNRGNYLAPIDFESFKESGGIEYTADVVWGLQLDVIHDPIFDKKEGIKAKREKMGEAKAANPRQIELVCLKNRNGKPSFSCSFSYWSNFDFYEPNMNGAIIPRKGIASDDTNIKLDLGRGELEEITMDSPGVKKKVTF